MPANWPYSTHQWRRLRAMVLTDQPLCRYCQQMGQLTPATVCDHIKPVRLHPELAFEYDNLQPMCERCHNGIRAQEDKTGRRIGCGIDGVPLAGW